MRYHHQPEFGLNRLEEPLEKRSRSNVVFIVVDFKLRPTHRTVPSSYYYSYYFLLL